MKIVRSLIVFVLKMFTDNGKCEGGGDGSCSLYNPHNTNYLQIHTQRIVGLSVRAFLFP